jgi:hypothetical protein
MALSRDDFGRSPRNLLAWARGDAMREPAWPSTLSCSSSKTNQLVLCSSCDRWEIAMTLEKMPAGKLQSLGAKSKP